MGTSDILANSLSGALTSRRALATAGHNIANANTQGFSRQRVEVESRPPQLSGSGAIGTGVKIANIRRIHDDFIISDMRSNASLATGLQTNYEFSGQIDNMLADPNAGLAPTLHSFFNAINNVSNDPSSQAARQVLIGEANSLSERFSYLDSRFEVLHKGINETLESHVKDVNTLAKALGDINWKVVLTKGITQGEVNDLLDQRDRLLHQLSEKVSVTTNEQEDGALNVFIGNGQPLVLGKHASSLILKANQHDPYEMEIVYKNKNIKAESVITNFMKGGSIGGLLDFRENMLGKAQNELGRIAIGVTKTFNDQHHKGMTLDNALGGDFFKPIDKVTPLSLSSITNDGDYELKTTITNVDNLTVSDYVLNYNAGVYTLIRKQDDEIIGHFNSLPKHFESEGFTVELERGTTIKNGDSFMLRPTRAAAREFAVEIENTNDIAAAAPVRVRTSIHNMGEMKASLNNVADINTPSFTTLQGSLSPTITIRFVDENHIELLDDKGKLIQAQQLNEQNKDIPATPGVAGERGSPATPAVPAISASKATIIKSLAEGEHDGGAASQAENLEEGIFYDPEKGINLFPTPGGMKPGYSIQLSGKAKAGDTFVIEYNTDAAGNNINALHLAELQNKATLDNGTSNYNEVYSQLVSSVGSKTHELDVNREAQDVLYEQAKARREEVSGVNLDEEAADLMRYQQAYQANAKVVGAANEMFDTLLGVLRR